MAATEAKQLHWTQRIALVRHNLHAACRSGDFGFFKSLQAAGMMEGTNHFATLSAFLGDDADTLLAALDNLNGALAFIHQDAFQSVYNSLKDELRDDRDLQTDKSKLFVDVAMQKNKAEMSIDKLSNSAIALINQQLPHVQDEAANVYITGMTLASDCVEVTMKQLDSVHEKMDDFMRLEESLNIVKGSVLAANAGLKGVFYMLDQADPQGEKPRNLSISSASSAMLRRISNAFQTQSPSNSSRNSSIASAGGASVGACGTGIPIYRTPNYVRHSISTGCPTAMPPSSPSGIHSNFDAHKFNGFQSHTLTTIPPTPAYDDEMDPFENAVSALQPMRGAPRQLEERRMSQPVM